jgi:malate permease and related proteins
MLYLTTFANNLLPILLLSGSGFALGKFVHVEPRPLGRVIFYILSPVLVFNLLIQNDLSLNKIAGMMGYSASVMLIVAGLAFLAGLALRLERKVLIAVVLTAMLANNGNYGIPLIGFAFGQEAQAYASIYFVTSSLMSYTAGVLIVSLGQVNLMKGIVGLFKVPAIYAIVFALVFVRFGWTLPDPLARTVSLAAGGAIPAMLILLGLELSRVEWSRSLRALSIPVASRLIVGPLIGMGLAALFGLTGPARQAGITEAGMPTAVLTSILATEYMIEPQLVTAIIFVSTILSPLTLTPLLVYLGR